MALSQAEKQRRYRERHLGDGEKQRIQCVVSLRTKLKLKRLAHYYGCSLTALIENLAADAEELIVRQIASRDIGDYYSAKLQCTSALRSTASTSPSASYR
jgi:hypothetical protein